MSDMSGHRINDVEVTWKELYERERQRVIELERYQIMLSDLDRNASGRHQGDGDAYDPSGISQGNPHLLTGVVIGYTIHGSHQYVVPEPHLRRDLNTWLVKA